MSRVAACVLVTALFAAPVFAAVSDIDTDGDNLASYEEMVAKYTDLSEEIFAEIDTNDDGFVDDAEMTAAADAALLVEPAQ